MSDVMLFDCGRQKSFLPQSLLFQPLHPFFTALEIPLTVLTNHFTFQNQRWSLSMPVDDVRLRTDRFSSGFSILIAIDIVIEAIVWRKKRRETNLPEEKPLIPSTDWSIGRGNDGLASVGIK